MRIKDCLKGFNQGINKVIHPKETCRNVLGKIKGISPSILRKYFYCKKGSVLTERYGYFISKRSPTKIPICAVMGTKNYSKIYPPGKVSGKGHFKEQALASGLMEFVERYSCFKYLYTTKNILASFKDFKNNLFCLHDLNFNYMVDIKDKDRELLKTAKIRWHKAYTLDGKIVFLPMNLLFFIKGSIGMAAGNTYEEALLHGIYEVIEGHCVTVIEKNKLETPLIDLSTINSDIVEWLINEFRNINHQIFIKDFSLGIGLPIIGVVRYFNKNNVIITCGVASTPEEALIRALVENAQIDDNPEFYRKIPSIKHHLINTKTISFNDIPDRVENKNIKIELETVRGILNKQNMEIFFVEATDKMLNIPCVIVFIRGAQFSMGKSRGLNLEQRKNILEGLLQEHLETKNYIGLERIYKAAMSAGLDDVVSFYKGAMFYEEKKYPEALYFLSRVSGKKKTYFLMRKRYLINQIQSKLQKKEDKINV